MLEETPVQILRVGVARIAQSLGVQTDQLPVLDKDFTALVDLAKQERGWNRLCAVIVEEISDLRRLADHACQ